MIRPLDMSKVLIVDDDPDFLELLHRALTDAYPELDIQKARDGDTAVRVWESTHHGVVFLDMMLPKRSGFLVMERLLTASDSVKPIIIMVTANEGPRHKTYAESLGCDAYYTKPVRLNKMIEELRHGLELAQGRNKEADNMRGQWVLSFRASVRAGDKPLEQLEPLGLDGGIDADEAMRVAKERLERLRQDSGWTIIAPKVSLIFVLE